MNCKAFLLASLLAVLISASMGQTPTTTPTPKPTTTPTPKPTTTPTPKPTTTPTPKPTTTPTPKPTTTPTPKPVTTPKPAPTTTPAEPDNTYRVKDDVNNVTCIELKAEIEMTIPYEMKTGKTTKNETVTVIIGNDFTSSGSCGNKSQSLVVTFNKDWTLTYTFAEDSSTSYSVTDVALKYTLDAAHFPNATKPGTTVTVSAKAEKDYLKSTTDGYYVCNAEATMDVKGVSLKTKNLKYKAFNTKPEVDMSTGTVAECSADEDLNSIVPIAVGAALAGLVVIVLIAYLIGRKRTRKTGYESV